MMKTDRKKISKPSPKSKKATKKLPKKTAATPSVAVVQTSGVEFVSTGGVGRPHRFETALQAAMELTPGNSVKVETLGFDKAERSRAIVSISQGIHRRGMRTLPNGARLRVRSGKDGNIYIACR